MEKVQVISLKPLSPENDDCAHSLQYKKSVSNAKDLTSKNVHQSRSASLPLGTSPVTSNLALKKDKYNSSIKNAFSRVSLKHTSQVNQVDKNINNQKSGLLASTNCFGRSDFRVSYNEKIKSRSGNSQLKISKKGKNHKESGFVYLTANAVVGSVMYRSNSSLELDHDLDEYHPTTQYFKRQYGSHGSINVSTAQQESLQSVLNSYRKQTKEAPESKSKIKLPRLWEKDRSSILRKILPNKGLDVKEDKSDISSGIGLNLENASIVGSITSTSVGNMEGDSKEDVSPVRSIRRPAISHYDCQSLAAQMNASRIKILLADRSNTTTGASAAATAETNSSSNLSNECNLDLHMKNSLSSNHLVSSCPYFLNEVGGEGEREVCLSRDIVRPLKSSNLEYAQLHRSFSASSVGVLEPMPGSSYGCQTLCPYVKRTPTVESIDQGSQYFCMHFKTQEYQNWFGLDENLGPVAISIKKEKIDDGSHEPNHNIPVFQYRFIFRTADLFTCQGTIREEILHQRGDKSKGLGVKEAIEYICPNLNIPCLRSGNTNPETEEALVKIDELGIHKKFKVGVMYCRAGQVSEEDMYNNEHSGPAFSEFLEVLGQRVRLKDFDKHRGGLDKKTDSTGHYSVYTQYQDCEIMFHVSTLLPYTANNRKQLLRKRHIGNDIVTIIFQEPGALPFSPKHIRSHFQHVFIVVQAINPCTDSTQYSVAVSRFQDVPMFGPPIPENYTFPKSRKFTNFLLAKVINGELAALRSEKFVCMAARTKHEYLKDLAQSFCSGTPLDTGSKFSLMGFSRASKKEKHRFKFVADSTVKGAVSWNLTLRDATLQTDVDCILGVSLDLLVIVETATSSAVFSVPCKSVLGWTLRPKQGLHIFYHQGECLILNIPEGVSAYVGDEILSDIISRLKAVTPGAGTQELALKRNSAGLLGFNVQQDGIITEVEPFGLAAQAKLLQGSRLVQICTVALSTLSQEQMVDLLKTSVTVTVTVIPPHPDGTPRRGCNVPTCSFLLGGSEGDYENLTPPESGSAGHLKSRLKQLNRYDRSMSPPRSGSSSGYGTGSSSHSFSLEAQNKNYAGLNDATYVSCHIHDNNGPNTILDHGGAKYSEYTSTLSSTSSCYSNGDRWPDGARINIDDAAATNLAKVASNPQQAFNSLIHPSVQRYSPYAFSHRDPQPPTPPPPPLPVRQYQYSKEVMSNLRAAVQGDDASYQKLMFSAPSHTASGPASGPLYETSYAVPSSLMHPASKDSEQHYNGGPCGEVTKSWGDYDNAPSRNLGRRESSAKQVENRRNSSPLVLESREESEEAGRKEASRGRHSIPKTGEDRLSVFPPAQINAAKSEDELSGSSGSSPHVFVKPKTGARGTGSPSSAASSSSRAQSPHTHTNAPNSARSEPFGQPLPASVRLKHGAQKNLQHRNSASLASSNLQEELLKLINPDYLSDSESIGAEIRQKKKKSSSVNRRFPTAVTSSRSSDSPCSLSDTVNEKQSPADNLNNNNAVTPLCTRTPLRPNQLSDSNKSSYGSILDTSVQPTPSVKPSNTASSGGFPDTMASAYQTIGEKEFTSRKNVFTNGESAPIYQNANKELAHTSEHKNPSKSPVQGEDFVLTARPATVISNASTASSPCHSESKEKAGPFGGGRTSAEPLLNRQGSAANPNLTVTTQADGLAGGDSTTTPDVGSVIEDEWSTLVNTATIAFASQRGANGSPVPSNAVDKGSVSGDEGVSAGPAKWDGPPWAASEALTSAFMSSVPREYHAHMPAYFQKFLADSHYAAQSSRSNKAERGAAVSDNNGNRTVLAPSSHSQLVGGVSSTADDATRELIQTLKKALETEQRISGKLQQEVTFLRNENSKLLQDSRAAAQQLHQFTEWFFKNVHKA